MHWLVTNIQWFRAIVLLRKYRERPAGSRAAEKVTNSRRPM